MKTSPKIKSVTKKFNKDIVFAGSEGFVAILCPIYEDMEPCYIESEYDEFVIDELLLENDWDEAVLIDLTKDKSLLVCPSVEAA